ncbi:serum response factor-binding protein 1-like isoform X2 [Labrus bergylta]|uniref:serum response factor-binding protein 1-like isoform X2 n=1 Tax=Labrus bergylta TaxID=56723 RepID=UPI003313C6C3
MTKAVVLFSVLLLGCSWSLQGVHTQEDDIMEQKVNGAEAPAVDAPAADDPAVDAPAVDATAVEAPDVDAPAADDPAVEAPAVEAPAVEAPADDAPAVEAPAVEAPDVNATAVEAPDVNATAVEAPDVEAPAVEAPAVEAPAVEAPAVNATDFNKTEVCVLGPETGPCRAFIDHYFYNSTSMNCEIFTYGGCDGNQNNFVTESDCLHSCHTEEPTLKPKLVRIAEILLEDTSTG